MKLQLSTYEPVSPALDFELSLDEETGFDIAEAIAEAKTLPGIGDDKTLALCIEGARTLKRLLDGIESSRESLKGPIFRAGKKIDEFAKKVRAELEAAYGGLARRIAVYEAEVHEARMAEKAAKNREVEQLAKEAFDTPDAAKRDMLLAEARAKQIEAKAATAATQGMRMTERLTFELEDLMAVLAFEPKLLKIELSQSACLAMVRAMREAGAKEVAIPGIKITRTMVANVSGK